MITSTTITHEISLDEIKRMLARELKVYPEAIQVGFVLKDTSTDDERFPRYEVDGVRVTVNNAQNERIRVLRNSSCD